MWRKLRRVDEDEAQLLMSTERMAYAMDGVAMAPRCVLHAFRIYRGAKLEEPIPSLEELLDWLAGCKYERDPVLFGGRPDVWLHPEDFERTRIGDCEDHALYAWIQLARMGIPAYFVVGLSWRGNGHAWVAYESPSGLRLLETTAKSEDYWPVLVDDEPDYVPYWAVDHELRYFARGDLLTVPIGVPSPKTHDAPARGPR